MANDGNGLVRLLEMLDLLSRKLNIDRGVCFDRDHVRKQTLLPPAVRPAKRRDGRGNAAGSTRGLTDQLFQFIKGRGADDGSSDD